MLSAVALRSAHTLFEALQLIRLHRQPALLTSEESLASEKAILTMEKADQPHIAPCVNCRNLAMLFATGSSYRVIRRPWTVSKNSLLHHEYFRQLVDSTAKCDLCALMVMGFAEPPASQEIKRALKEEKFSYIRDPKGTDKEDDGRKPVCVLVEEQYGFGKLISHLGITVYLGSSSGGRFIAIADEVLRIYSEPGMCPYVRSYQAAAELLRE